jgi:SAM-dependent methyltransferase
MKQSNALLNCLIDGTNLVEIIDLGLHAFADTFIGSHQLEIVEPIFPLVCMLCPECGMVQLKYITHDFDRYNLYSYSYTSSNSNFSRSHWNEFANSAIESSRTSIKLVVEIGSNDGYLLQQFKPFVERVIGVDSSEEMSRIANGLGVQTLNTLFDSASSSQIIEEYGKADLIIANNVLNHSNHPVDFVSGVSNLLSEDGRFIFEVPYWSSTVTSLHFDQIYHEHVTYFTVRSIEKLLDECGMSISQISVVDYHGGSLRVTAINGRNKTMPKGIGNLITEEEELRLYEAKTYIDYVEQVNLNRSKFLTKVHQIIGESKSVTIAGVGAAAKANTLLTYYGLNNSYIDFITDSSEHKIGKFTPFTRIPVYGDAEFAKHEEIVAIVLSWNIGDTLRANIQAINKNVRFLEL